MRSLLEKFRSSNKAKAMLAGALIVIVALVGAFWYVPQIHRKPPSIFDTPVDGVLDYLASDHFSRLSIQERLDFIAGILKRFQGFSQNESALASSFFAGLAGPANEKLVNNARILGKDILVQGASEYLALTSPAERDAYIDKWLVDWVRFAEQADGRGGQRTDQEILNRMSEQAKRDQRQYASMEAEIAQQIIDFWDRDVASVASPREQAQIGQFFPAIRQRLVTR